MRTLKKYAFFLLIRKILPLNKKTLQENLECFWTLRSTTTAILIIWAYIEQEALFLSLSAICPI
jgi:hypothetical protein